MRIYQKIIRTAIFVFLISLFSAQNLAAQDCNGNEFIFENSTWKYDDTNTDLDTVWRTVGFNDSAWQSGAGVLGYGENYIATTLASGSGRVTYYFRISFESSLAPSSFAALHLNANFDDGFVAYLNGFEVTRQSLPAGTITFNTTASLHEGGDYEEIDISAHINKLIVGTNVFAVEVHNQSSSSSDIVWDASLSNLLASTACVTRGPYLQRGTPNSVVVKWRTNVATDSRVRYGTNPASLTSIVDDLSSTTEHEVLLTGLTPDTKYYYSIGSTTGELASGTGHFFVTNPTTGTRKNSRFWIVGDPGTGDSFARRVRDAYETFTGSTHTDLWLMLGDNAYEDGTDTEYQTAVFDVYPAMLKKSVLWPTFGNHDAGSANSNAESGVYYDIFTLPRSAEAGGLASGTEAYYSFDYANVHFICLNSYDINRSVGGQMMTWLANDLAATNQEWIITFWHHPPYSRGVDDSDTATRHTDMRENALPIFEAGGLDLGFFGHSHSYERSFLMDGHYDISTTLLPAMILDNGDGRADGDSVYSKATFGQAANEGAVYIVAGSSARTSGGLLNHPIMFESLNELGSVILDINQNRADVTFLNDNGTIRDYFTMIKGALDSTLVFRVERSTGNVFAHGSFIGGGADLAERIYVSEPVEAGDVIELDPDTPEHYRKACGSGKLIAGVITTEPGFILGNDSKKIEAATNKDILNFATADRHMLTLMGRVPVKATTENGAIQPGDLLTIANKPGYAMRCLRAKKCEGAIIGKALETLESDEGIIQVFVMVQ